MANTARLTVKGIDGVVEVSFDVAMWRGDVLETLEDHLGGESVFAWARRWADALAQGVRLSEFRTRDLIGLVYLGSAMADPESTWQGVARSIAPLTLNFLPDDEPAPEPPPVSVGVSPDLGQQVPDPGPVSFSPTLAALDVPGAHEQPGEPPTGADLYRTP